MQSLGYSVKYIHNSHLQFLVENGLLFTLLLIYLFVYTAIQTYKTKNYAYTAIILLICAHSFIDFDLSFGLILIISGFICGNSFFNKSTNKPKIFKAVTYAVLALCFTVLIYSSAEFVTRNGFEKAYISKKYDVAQKYNNILIKLCPRDPQVYINEASLIQIKSGKMSDKAIKNLETAISLSPNDHQVLREYIKACANKDNIKELADRYLKLNPMREDAYVFIKDTTEKLYESNEISKAQHREFLKTYEDMRIKHNVSDRNKLLRETLQKKEG